METEEAVAHIAEVMADAEGKAATIRQAMRSDQTKAAWHSLRDNLTIGNLEMQSHFRRLDALATTFEAELFVIHWELTQRAQALGVDLPQPLSGGR